MDIDVVSAELNKFITQHKTQFDNVSKRGPQVLELGCLVLAAEHYKVRGFTVKPVNLVHGSFRVKTTAKGYPFNFSWFNCEREGQVYQIHANLPVFSAYGKDNGVYCVDVGVVMDGYSPKKEDKAAWKAVLNEGLVTFIEAKHLVIYPMLLAQFLGIVHEIKPGFLNGPAEDGFGDQGHFFPALASIGYMHGIAAGIRNGFEERGFRINVLDRFDSKISALRNGGDDGSPLLPKLPESPAVSCSTEARPTAQMPSPPDWSRASQWPHDPRCREDAAGSAG